MNAMSDWGHAYVIPLISGYLIWRGAGPDLRTPVRTFWPGLLPFLLRIGGILRLGCGIIKNHMLQGHVVVLTIAGLAAPMRHADVPPHLPADHLPALCDHDQWMVMIKITFQLRLIASQGRDSCSR